MSLRVVLIDSQTLTFPGILNLLWQSSAMAWLELDNVPAPSYWWAFCFLNSVSGRGGGKKGRSKREVHALVWPLFFWPRVLFEGQQSMADTTSSAFPTSWDFPVTSGSGKVMCSLQHAVAAYPGSLAVIISLYATALQSPCAFSSCPFP